MAQSPLEWGAVAVETPAQWGAVAVESPAQWGAIEVGKEEAPSKTLSQFFAEPPAEVSFPGTPLDKNLPSTGEQVLPKPVENREQYQELRQLYTTLKGQLNVDDVAGHQQLDRDYQASLKQLGITPLTGEVTTVPTLTPETMKALGASETTAKVVAGSQQAVAEAINGLLSQPELLLIGGMPRAAQRMFAGVFAAQMAATTPGLLIDFNKAVKEKDWEGAAKALTSAGVQGAMAVTLGREATGAAAKARTEATAGREMLRQVEETPLIVPDLVARNVAAPGTVRPTEITALAAPAAERLSVVQVVAPQTAKALQEVSLVQKASPELMETAQRVAQRREEAAAPKLESTAKEFTGTEPTPGFLQTAEQKLISRTSEEIPFESLGISPRGLSMPAKAMGQVVGGALDYYSLPLTERLAKEGGSQAKGFANMAREISERSKELYGSITPTLDPALEAVGSRNATTTWLNDIAPTANNWGYRNAVNAVEGPIAGVPAKHQGTVNLLKAANLDIGRLAAVGVPGFVATGKYQRIPSAFLVDAIRAGRGPAHDLLVRALSAENRIPAAQIKTRLAEIKAEFDAPGSQQTIHKIAQEFERKFPKFPTDLKINGVWTPILHAKPFEYLQNAALATSQRAAFLERVPQGTLGQLREGIVSELKSPEAFDELVRALHGLPVDQPMRFFAPGSPAGIMAAGVGRVLSDIFSPLKLTASALYNIPETFLGNTPAFFGWRNFLRGAGSLLSRRDALEQLGAINRNLYNWSFDPKAPVRSTMKDFRNVLRKSTLQQFFNEMQEMLAASTAQVFAERIQGGKVSVRERALFQETASAMGFTRPQAKAMSEGRGTPEQYDNFTRRASSFATGGNMQAAEQSRFGGNRVLTGLFRFQSYPMMKMNAFRKAYENVSDAIQSGEGSRIKASSEQLAKFLFGTAAQGAATSFLAAYLTGGKTGTEIKAKEVKDEPGEFVLDSLLSGVGGPVSAINHAVGSGRTMDLLDPRNINPSKTFPGSVYMEMLEMFRRKGAFKDLSLGDAIGKYVTEKVPAGRIARTQLAAIGLAQRNTDLDQSIRAFYRWRREELGFTEEKAEISDDSRAKFRQHMKKAAEAMKHGKDFVPELVKAAEAEGITAKSMASSLRARTVLKGPDGKKLTPEQTEAATKRIGQKAYDRIVWYDAMLEAVADAVQ